MFFLKKGRTKIFFSHEKMVLDYYPFGMLLPNRHESTNAYRYGFQGQEKDDEIKGEGNSLNYKYRMHDPRIGRFFAVDPLTAEYPQWSPYSFSGNQVIHTVELEGLEPEVDLNNNLTGYKVKDGQGPSHIANDLNNPETQEQYGYSLDRDIKWEEIVYQNPVFFPDENVWFDKWDANDISYTHLNMNEGDLISLSFTQVDEFSSTTSDYWSGSVEAKGLLLAELGMYAAQSAKYGKNSGATVRFFTNSGKTFNPKIYSTGWGGGSVSKIKTYKIPGVSKIVGKAFGPALGLYNANDLKNQYQNGKINGVQLGIEQTSNAFSTFGGIHGAAWGIGWESGRTITSIPGYHENFRVPFQLFFGLREE